jgi:hypothetical protein
MKQYGEGGGAKKSAKLETWKHLKDTVRRSEKTSVAVSVTGAFRKTCFLVEAIRGAMPRIDVNRNYAAKAA